VASVDPTAARFLDVPAGAGHYESFYLKLCHPTEPLGAWIRYTVHKAPNAEPNGSLWFTLFSAGAPRAAKLSAPRPEAAGADWLRVGEARIGADGARGSIPGPADAGAGTAARDGVAWELALEAAEEPLFHLPAGWMYRGPVPRTKLLSPAPAGRFAGQLTVDGRVVDVDGWRGMAGHNWGAQHAERWIWLHGLTQDGDWLDAAIGRVKLGPVTTPWIGNGALSIAGDRHALRRARVTEFPDRCTFELTGRGVQVRGTVEAPRERFVGWVYADPDGSEHHAVNCSIADMRLTVRRRGGASSELVIAHSAAYELGMREHDHGIEIQPYPDG
jgi:hypothetical protein